jgi:hypothetical protein
MVIESRIMRWTGHAVSVVLMKITYTVLVKIFERKKLLGRASDGLEDNIKTYLQEAGYDGCNWTHESLNGIQWRDVSSTEMEHAGSIKGKEFLNHPSVYQLFRKGSASWSWLQFQNTVELGYNVMKGTEYCM